MAAIKVPTNFNIDVEFEIPEFFRRLVSLIIDVIIEYFYLRIAVEIFKTIINNSNLDADSQYNLQAIGLLLFLPVLVYHVVLEITMNGQSLGKRILGIRVVNEIGGRPSISQFMIRWLLRISDVWIFFIIFLLASNEDFTRNPETGFIILAALAFLITDIILVASSKKGQRIGDILAKTILIRTKTKVNIEDTVFMEVADSYVPSFPQIMQLNDKDINAIKRMLEISRKTGDLNIAEQACYKIKTYLKIESSMHPHEFLNVLLKDYNYLSTK